MEFKAILREMGVTDGTLSAEEKSQLDHDGFCVLRNVFSREELAGLQGFIDGFIAGSHPTEDEPGCQRLYHLIDKNPLFDEVWAKPQFLAAAWHVMKEDFRPMSVNYRTAMPGHGNQELHSDSTWTLDGRHSYGQAIIPMVDFTADNGPTRLVPGTHRGRNTPQQDMKDCKQRHPKQIEVLAPADSVIFFNGCLWHSGTQNNSKTHRPALHCGYALRHSDSVSMENQRSTITPEMYSRLSPLRRNFLDMKVSNKPGNTDLHMI